MVKVQFGLRGTGNVIGPNTATDRAIAIYNLATGKVIQNSPITISATGVLSGIGAPLVGTDGVNKDYVDTHGGTGDVHGPAGVPTINAVALFDGLTGKYIKTSLVIINASGDIDIPAGRKYYIGGVQISVGDVYGAAPLASPIFSGTVQTPVIKITTGAGTGKVLTSDAVGLASWGAVAGDVVGPAGATDTAIAIFDTATGKKIKNSLVTINASGDVNIPSGRMYYIDGVNIFYNRILTGTPYITTTPAVGDNSHKIADTAFVMANVGSGNVVGPTPAVSTNNAIVRWDGAGGRTIKNSINITVDDTGLLTANSFANVAGNFGVTVSGVCSAAAFGTAGISTALAFNTLDPTLAAYLQITGVGIVAQGTNPNIDLQLYSKGAGQIYINGVPYSGGGNVVGPTPAVSTDHAIARWDGITGRILQNSEVIIDDAGMVTANGFFTSGPLAYLQYSGVAIVAAGTNPDINIYLYSKGVGGVFVNDYQILKRSAAGRVDVLDTGAIWVQTGLSYHSGPIAVTFGWISSVIAYEVIAVVVDEASYGTYPNDMYMFRVVCHDTSNTRVRALINWIAQYTLL